MDILGSPTIVGMLSGLLSYFLSFFFLQGHGIQQPRRVRPSNVYRRFGRRCSSNNLSESAYQSLAHRSPNFYRWVKKCEIGVIFNVAQLWGTSVWKWADISTLQQILNAAMIALCSRQVWWSSVHAPQRTIGRKCPIPQPPSQELDGENVLNGQ